MSNILVQSVNDLPNFVGAKQVYLDLETTSRRRKVASTNPWKSCHLLGASITVDDCPDLYYIPVEHRPELTCGLYHNVPKEGVVAWIRDVLSSGIEWVNHNLKYDAHVLRNDCGIDVRGFPIILCDTLSRAKIIDSDKFNYNLTVCARDFLFEDIEPYEERLKREIGRNCKDYGYCPIDTMRDYSCKDIDIARALNKYCTNVLPPECQFIWDVETELTKILFDIECNGMTVDQAQLDLDTKTIPYGLQLMRDRLANLMGEKRYNPNKDKGLERLICEKLGLPIVDWTEKGEPSFGHDALMIYLGMPNAPVEVIKTLMHFKDLYKLYTSFTLSYLELMTEDGKIHSDYNQIVRTGRMSCRTPNAQQLSPEAKVYIIPSAPDRMIVEIDLSQIEFRVIVHYINNLKCIAAYNNDPRTDFHQLVADLCHIPRKPAKNVNFMLGYGGGKGKCISMLKSVPEIIGELKTTAEIEERAISVYNSYHRTLPELKRTQWVASSALRQQGFVRTYFKRRRHIPQRFHFKSFNSVCQGSAADIMKIITLRIAKYLRNQPDIKLIGIVHDSWLYDVPKELINVVVPELHKLTNYTPEGFKVPVYSEVKKSDKNWRECEQVQTMRNNS